MNTLAEMGTRAYFMEEYNRFRAIMCSREFTIEQKERALGGLFLVYLNIPETEMEKAITDGMDALLDEFSRRVSYELLHPRETR